DGHVTGVQTCALPISLAAPVEAPHGDAARRQIAHRLEMLLDELAEPDRDDAGGARLANRLGHRQVSPAQRGPVARGKAAPDEGRSEERRVGKEWRKRL